MKETIKIPFGVYYQEQFSKQCHLVSNQDMLDLLLDSALVMLLLP